MLIVMLVLADIVWPGLYLAEHWLSVPIILASLIIEWPIYKFAFSAPWRKAFYATLLANAASCGLGLCCMPLGTFGWEFATAGLWNRPTFSRENEISTSLFAAMICTVIEYPAAALFLKRRYTGWGFFAIYAANVVTVGIAAEFTFHITKWR